MSEPERLARVALSLVAEPGDPVFLGLTHELGAREFLQALLVDPHRHDELRAAASRLPGIDPERELERADRLGIRFVVPGDEEWPACLEDLAGAGTLTERGAVPVGLWVRGPVTLDRLGRSVAIVGSRSATSYGEEVASGIAAGLGYADVPVVSGGAFGIDVAAHRGADSAGGVTVAVLACGADRVYPEAHRSALDYLGREHAIVSEAPLGAAPHRIRFLARNRLIAALSLGTVVVEAALRSGALSTANWAQRLHRVVMGVPGPVTSATSEGVHQLIRTGAATLVTHGQDVLELVGRPGEHLVLEPRGPEQPRDALTVKQRQVLDAVPVGAGAASDSIARVAGLGVIEVRTVLDKLQQAALVERDGGGWRITDEARA